MVFSRHAYGEVIVLLSDEGFNNLRTTEISNLKPSSAPKDLRCSRGKKPKEGKDRMCGAWLLSHAISGWPIHERACLIENDVN